MIEYPIPLSKKSLKISSKELSPCDQSRKNVLEKRTQPDKLNQLKKRVRINEITANLEVNSLEVIKSMTTALQMKLNKSYDTLLIKLDRFYNPTIPKIDLCAGLSVRLICKLVKSLI